MKFWKILRILVTNECNYKCLYCHNEGQEKEWHNLLSFDNFLKIMEEVKKTSIREIRISGGEPLLNKETIKMIEWLDKNTDYEIGLATNGSLMTEEIARRLGKTRILITLHLPSVVYNEYEKITCGNLKDFYYCSKLLKKYNISYSLNYVLYPNTINNLETVIQYALEERVRIKLLPYIENTFQNFSTEIIKNLDNILKEKNLKKKYDYSCGITFWSIEDQVLIKVIDSPCYEKNIKKCRNYGEIRVLPDMSFQSCIFGEKIKIQEINNISTELEELWSKFDKCLKEE